VQPEDIQVLKNDIRDAQGRLEETIREIRRRVSYETFRNRAATGVREVAVEKSRRVAGVVLRKGHAYAEQAWKVVRENPVIPLMIGISVLAPRLIRRILRRRGSRPESGDIVKSW
jgi:hypothetical protein